MRRWGFMFAVFGAVTGAWPLPIGMASAQQEESSAVQEQVEDGEPAKITMNFQDVDIAVLVKFISDITGKNFIVDEKVRGKVTIISPGKISVDEAYLVFQSVLQVKGFTTVPAGSIIKILPTKDAKTSTIDTVLPETRPQPRDEYITRLIRLKYVDANNMVAILQPLASPDGLLTAYTPTNTLIIIDTAAQTDRLAKILSQLDVEGQQQEIEVVRLNYAFAGDIAALLQQLLEEPSAQTTGAPATQPGAAPDARVRRGTAPRPGTPAAGGQAISGGVTPERAFKIIPDERTNSLILVAGPAEARRIKDLIARLDVPLPLGTGRIHVYYLKYANAFELIPVLSSLVGAGAGFGGFSPFGFGGIGGLRGGFGFGGVRGGLTSGIGRFGGGFGLGGFGTPGFGGFTPGFGGFGFGGLAPGIGLGLGQTGFGAAGSLAGRRPGLAGTTPGVAGGQPGQQSEFEGQVRISADPATNALIINASPQDFETLREVIEKLDVRRRQVYVEAIIAEVSLDLSRELGIELQGATEIPNGVGFGRTNLSGNINQLLNPTNLSGLVLAAASSQTVTVNGVTIPAQQALLRALESRSDANILSAPTVLTTDNQPAEIVSGQNVPFIASRATSDVNLSNTFATIERRDVGITLRLTPQISEGGQVRLDIFQEVSDVISNDPQLGPTTTIRSATTSVVTRDGQTVVIGGIMFEARGKNVSKVPFLGDIPVIGNAFRFDSTRNRKTNLLIFLTPHIIRNERDQRNVAVSERDRVLRKPYEEMGQRPPRWEQLYAPSWEVRPSIEPAPEDREPSERGTRSRIEVYKPGANHNGNPEQRRQSDPDVESRNHEQDAQGADVGSRPKSSTNRYILLALLEDSGRPLPSLETSNGLLALAVPSDAPLALMFQKGAIYRFESGGYRARYLCLEVFDSPAEAFASYPEGMRVSTNPPTFLHWREAVEIPVVNEANWKLS
ncbi:MAG: type II secretion system secretin GspD [Candidatus Binatia bacterium]|nr:type II secretion system secretin GspD [Candidatus Binatia bacterium]